MDNLFKLLFEDEQPDADTLRLFEAAEKSGDLDIKKVPLKQALADLGLDGTLEVTPDGMVLVYQEDPPFHAAVKLLGTPETVAQLASSGWVANVGGDVRPGNEEPRYVINFLELDDPKIGEPTLDAPSTEELALTAAKFNGFAAQDAKVVPVPVAKAKVSKAMTK